MPVLVRGEQLSRVLRLDKLFRLNVFPLAISLPWGICPGSAAAVPICRSKIRTRLLPVVEVENDPDRAEDDEYVERKYFDVQNCTRLGMDTLARKRALPLFG